jgi:polysaccharide biosynthesis transport protein
MAESQPIAIKSHIGGGAEDAAIQSRTLRDYYIILRERIWIALPLALLVSIGLGYWQSRATPMYRSRATMQFEKPDTIVTSQGVVDPFVHSEMDINTYLQVLESQKLRASVVDSFTPDEQKILLRPALRNLAPGQPPPPVGSMLGNVQPDSIGKSYLISVTVEHQDPDAAALIANRYIKQFMLGILHDVGGTDDYAMGFLQTRAEQLRKEMGDANNALEKYMRDNNLVSLDKSLNLVADGLKTVNDDLTTARLALISQENLVQQIEDYRSKGKDLLEIDYIANHGAVNALRAQLSGLTQQKDALSERYLERHPLMIEVDGKIAVTRDLLNREIAGAIDDLNASVAEKRQNVDSLQSEYGKREKDELALRAMKIDYDALETQANAAKSNYEAILDRLNQTNTTRDLERIPLHVLDNATPNYTPFQPDFSHILRLCVSLGVLTFVGVAVGLTFIDDRIKSAWDIESFIGVNLLGIVPDLSGVKNDEKYTLLIDNKQISGVEPFLNIYSSIKIHSKLDYPKSMLVTSTIPGEGKTLVSSNLAGCFARHGKNTLLIDCDLRRPMLHRHFRLQNSVGLISWFESGASLEGNLVTNPHLGITKIAENLSLLSSGGRSKSPTEMLETPVFGQLLEQLKKHYDLVVVDSPPMGAVTDALLLASRTDEIVYVCRFNRAYRKHIKLYMRTLLNGKNVVLGIVLNGLSPRRIEYYSNYRYYRSYKKYYGAQA